MIKRFFSLVYPNICLVCESSLDFEERSPFCKVCEEEIKFLKGERICMVCGRPVESGICYECSRGRRYLDFSRSVALYEGKWREIIHLYKYHGFYSLFSYLGEKLLETYHYYAELGEADFVLPVPIHFVDRLRRGFHHTYLLARYLSKRTGKSLLPRILYKSRRTPSQTQLGWEERKRNVKGAYRAKNHPVIKGKNFLILDDVFTTGATLNECAKALKKAGAGKVYALTLARGE